jgi:hypothetical protein
VTRTAADPVPLNGGGVNGKVGPISRSFLPFALCFSDLGLGFDDSVFVNSKGGVNGKVGPIGRSFLPFALCFSDLGLGFDDSVFVNSKSISCYFISQTRSTT